MLLVIFLTCKIAEYQHDLRISLSEIALLLCYFESQL